MLFHLAPLAYPAQKKKRPRKGVFSFVRVGRIELPSHPWQGRVLPLNHTRNVRPAGIEPTSIVPKTIVLSIERRVQYCNHSAKRQKTKVVK